jgi:hypothetical protein
VSDLGDEYTESEARVSRIFDRLNQRIGAIIMGAADDAVKGVTDQLTKASAEIQAEVQKLQDAGVSDDALAGLKMSRSRSTTAPPTQRRPTRPATPAPTLTRPPTPASSRVPSPLQVLPCRDHAWRSVLGMLGQGPGTFADDGWS